MWPKAGVRTARLLLLPAACLSIFLHAQDENSSESAPTARVPPPVVSEMQRPIKVSHSYKLADGTPISLRLVKPINAKEAHAGDVAEFVLDHDLWVGDLLVAQAGVPAHATVSEASKAKWVSRRSKIAIQIDALSLLDGQVLPLRGVSSYHGGVGPAGQVGGYFVQEGLSCPLCEIAIVPVALGTLIAPGTNKDVKAETIAIAWVDGNITLRIDALRRAQPDAANRKAKISIVRGSFGGYANRDLYCNGIPLAHLEPGRKLELEVEPGYYRFAINPKKPSFEIYLGPGSDTGLITDHDHVYAIDEPGKTGKLSNLLIGIAPSRSANTTSVNPFKKKRSEAEYLREAKPVEANDRYSAECKALVEESQDGSN